MERVLSLPKADVHLHFESMSDIESLYSVASRNSFPMPITKQAFYAQRENFSCLTDLLNLLDIICSVAETYQDVYEIVMPYYKKASEKKITYMEPQVSLGVYSRIHPNEIIKGALMAASEAESTYGIKTRFIYDFTRRVPNERLKEILLESKPYHQSFAGIGVCGNEFLKSSKELKPLYDLAREIGLCRNNNTTAHTGEETPPNYVIESLHTLGLKRMDHAIRVHEDSFLMEYLGSVHFPIAMCPVSNHKIKVNERFCQGKYIYDKFTKAGCIVSINSDDPEALNSYLDEVYEDFWQHYGMDWPGGIEGYVQLVKNGFAMGFMNEEEKREYLSEIDSQMNKANEELVVS